MSVLAFGRRQIGQIRVEDAVAVFAAVLGEGYRKDNNLLLGGVAEVVEHSSADAAPGRWRATTGASAPARIPTDVLHPGRKPVPTGHFRFVDLRH